MPIFALYLGQLKRRAAMVWQKTLPFIRFVPSFYLLLNICHMFEQLLQLDFALFQLINEQWHNGFLDTVLPFWRSQYFWGPLYLFFLVFMLYNYHPKTVLGISVFLLLAFFLSDQLSAGVIKSLIPRLRPCRTPELAETVRLLVPCGSGKSFVSAHATNHFAIAVYVGRMFRHEFKWLLPVLLVWAASIAYAQVYVGLHFPTDVVAGAVLGVIIGGLVSRVANIWLGKQGIRV